MIIDLSIKSHNRHSLAHAEMKNALTPERKLRKEEQEALDEFNALFDGGDVNR